MALTAEKRAQMDAILKGGSVAPTTQATMKLDPAKRARADAILAGTSQTPASATPTQPGGFQSFIQGIAKPFEKVASSIAGIGEGTYDLLRGDVKGANEALSKERDFGYFGKARPIGINQQTGQQMSTGEGIKDILGTGAELGSYVVGGGGGAGVLKSTLGGALKQGFKTGVTTGVLGGALQGGGAEAQRPESTLGSIAGQTLLGGGIGGATGGILGATLPVAGAGIRKAIGTLTPEGRTANAVANIATDVDKGIKPYFGNKTTMGQRKGYYEKATDAVSTISERLPTFTDDAGIAVQRTPKTQAELLDAIGQTKKAIYSEYHSGALQAGEQGITFDASKTLAELNKIGNDLGYNPQIRNYAKSMMREISELHGQAPEVLEKRIADLNSSLGAFFDGRVTRAQAQIDASVANLLREELDNKITSGIGGQYQALRNKYGALKTIEKDVARQVNVQARKNGKGLLDFTDIFTGGDLTAGILSANPALVAKGLFGRGMKELYKHLNNPDRYIKKMFQESKYLPKSAAIKFAKPGLIPESRRLAAPAIVTPPPADTSRLFTQAEARAHLGETVRPKGKPMLQLGAPSIKPPVRDTSGLLSQADAKARLRDLGVPVDQSLNKEGSLNTSQSKTTTPTKKGILEGSIAAKPKVDIKPGAPKDPIEKKIVEDFQRFATENSKFKKFSFGNVLDQKNGQPAPTGVHLDTNTLVIDAQVLSEDLMDLERGRAIILPDDSVLRKLPGESNVSIKEKYMKALLTFEEKHIKNSTPEIVEKLRSKNKDERMAAAKSLDEKAVEQSKSDSPLLSEAKKYKTAEEFVKAMKAGEDKGFGYGKYGDSKLNPTEVGSWSIAEIASGKKGNLVLDKLKLSSIDRGAQSDFLDANKALGGLVGSWKDGYEVYRVVPKGKQINGGDFVFTNKRSAEEFLEKYGKDRGQTEIVSSIATPEELIMPDSPDKMRDSVPRLRPYNVPRFDEFIYAPKAIQNIDLLDIYKKAHSK